MRLFYAKGGMCMSSLYNDILDIFEKNSNILFGITNINFNEYKLNYKCALVFAVPHKELLSINSYKEEKLEKLICEASNRTNLLLEEITVLNKFKIQYYILPVYLYWSAVRLFLFHRDSQNFLHFRLCRKRQKYLISIFFD